MRKQVFTCEIQAQAAYDADPAAHSMTGYPAGEGYEASYTVYFDDEAAYDVAQAPKAMTTAELFAPALRAYAKEEHEAGVAHEQSLLAMGTAVVAEQVAEEKGLSGIEQEMFVLGFRGVHALIANPRKHGLEAIFRAGRAAKNDQGIAQRCRAAAVALRKDNPAPALKSAGGWHEQ